MTERIDDDSYGGGNSGSYTANSRAPRDNTEYSENPGTITSDSLAAESLANNGGFAGNQSGVSASGQSSYGSTASNTDTSGADTLAPSRDAPSRDDGDLDEYRGSGGNSSSGRGGGGYGGDSGSGSGTYGRGGSDSYGGGDDSGARSYAQKGSGADSYGQGGSDSYGSNDNGGNAPSAYSSAGGDQENLKPRPHGQNITEGGFDSDAPNASFNNDIGGKNDPGRYAENDFQSSNARSGGAAGYSGANSGGDSGGNQYEALDRDQ